MMHEWALLILTVCIPAVVGGFLFLWMTSKKLEKAGQETYQVMKLPLIVLAGLSIIGLFAAFFHLGTPTHAFYTVLGFGRSWMSNEIVVTGVFIALACITAGLALLQKKVNPLLMLLTGIVGLVDVFCMAKLYAVTQINGWNNINTYLVFYGTVFTLGPVLSASLMGIKLKGETLHEIVKSAFFITIFGIAIQAIGTAIFSVSIPDVQMINGASAVESLSAYGGMITVRWVLEVAGLILLGVLALTTVHKINYSVVYVALLILIIAEAMSRYAFYVIGA